MNVLDLFRRPTTTLRIQVFIEPDEGAFHAFNPAFPGLHVDGATGEEALANFAEALPGYLESLRKHGEPLPLGCAVIKDDPQFVVPAGAFLRYVETQWRPTRLTSGIS